MADEEEKQEEEPKKVEEEKKDEEKKENEQEKPEEKKTEEVAKEEAKPTKKEASKLAVSSKTSLKKRTDSMLTQSSGSSASATSLGMKRQSEYEKITKGPRYQNTYRLDPKRPFRPREVYKLLEEIVLRETAELEHYDGLTASKMVQSIAAEIRTSVKSFNYDRYKICVLVILGEKKLQGYQCAFRALWDQERDGWTTYFFQCRTYFLSCTCYGLYHD